MTIKTFNYLPGMGEGGALSTFPLYSNSAEAESPADYRTISRTLVGGLERPSALERMGQYFSELPSFTMPSSADIGDEPEGIMPGSFAAATAGSPFVRQTQPNVLDRSQALPLSALSALSPSVSLSPPPPAAVAPSSYGYMKDLSTGREYALSKPGGVPIDLATGEPTVGGGTFSTLDSAPFREQSFEEALNNARSGLMVSNPKASMLDIERQARKIAMGTGFRSGSAIEAERAASGKAIQERFKQETERMTAIAAREKAAADMVAAKRPLGGDRSAGKSKAESMAEMLRSLKGETTEIKVGQRFNQPPDSTQHIGKVIENTETGQRYVATQEGWKEVQ